MLKSRCKSEKKRRDKFNNSIQSLQAMLTPSNTKRLDKLTVLKMTVNYLKLHNGSFLSCFYGQKILPVLPVSRPILRMDEFLMNKLFNYFRRFCY